MRKILSLLTVITLSATVSTNIVACDQKAEAKATPVTPSLHKIDLKPAMLASNLHFLKAMTGQQAYHELRTKIKALAGGGYQNITEIKDDPTILISIWVAPNNCLTELISNAFAFVDKVDVKIKITENNKVFNQMALITLKQITIF